MSPSTDPASGIDPATWMSLALEAARKGLGHCSPNPPVGAALVRDQRLLGIGFHQKAGEAHAEVRAIEDAIANNHGEHLSEATLYVTLEPCSTQGRTPPCTEAILKHGIPRVVYGCSDPNPEHAGRGLDLLRDRGVVVEGPLLEPECQDLIRFFATHQLKGRPYVLAKTALTLDGHTSLPDDAGRWISSEASREDVQRLRVQMDAVLVGGETLRADDPSLTVRGKWAEQRPEQPWRVVLSQSGDLPHGSRLFTDDHAHRTLTLIGRSLPNALKELAQKDITSVMLESGGRLLGAALAAGLVDEVVFYFAPLIGGRRKGPAIHETALTRLSDIKAEAIGPDWRLNGRILEGSEPILP